MRVCGGPARARDELKLAAAQRKHQAFHVRIAAGMAQRHGQSQAHQLHCKGRIIQIRFNFADLAPVAQHQRAQPVQLVLGEACNVGIFQNVGTVPVVIAVGNATPDFVQLSCPVQFAQGRPRLVRRHLPEQRAGDACHALGMDAVCGKALHQALYGGGAKVGFRLFPIQKVVQGSLAQCALGHPHLLDVEQVENGAQDTQTATDHGAAIFLEPLQPDLVGTLGPQQPLTQPIQAGT